MGALRWLATALLLAPLLLGAQGSLMAIDLGSEYLKVCLVKPGRTPISVVVNEMSRRKSPALVGLVDGDRVLGEEAFSLGIRYPSHIYSQLRNLLGRSAADAEVQRLLADSRLPYTVVDDPARGTAALQVNKTTSFLVEELLAGVFQYAKRITDAQAGEPVLDAVVVVPAWFGAAQRTALLDAAGLAGLNVLGLVNSHAAAALQYGIERDFSKKEQLVVLYDMGSGSTEAALVRYSVYGRPGSSSKQGQTNQFEVLDVAWDHSLGSSSLDALLADHFAAQFQQQGGGDVRSNPKAMAKLFRAVRRTKEVLSANSAAPISVEELAGGRDFAGSIQRAEFEELAGPFWERAAVPVKALLARNKLRGTDVDAVELLGGGSRVPKLQAVLTEALDGRHLDRHLDADEAVVLGAGLFAANLSSSFRLRKFGMTDIAAFGVSFESSDLLLPAAPAGGKGAGAAKAADADAGSAPGHVLKSLLPAGKKLPVKRAIKYTNLTLPGFSFTLAYNASAHHGLPPGVTQPLLGSYTVAGIDTVVARYNQSGVMALRFEADYSGLLHFSSAECVVEQEVVEEVVVEVPAPAEAAASASKGADTKAADDGGEAAAAAAAAGDGDSDGEADKPADDASEGGNDKPAGTTAKPEADGDVAAATPGGNATSAAANKTATVKKTIVVPRKKTFHVALNVSGAGPAHAPLAGEALAAARAHVAAWQAAEAVNAATAKAKNDLEGYIIATRERLETDDALQQVTTEAARVAFTEQLTAAEDWLYGDGEAEAAAAFVARLRQLRDTGDPMAARAAELEARPQVLAAVKEQMGAARNVIAAWADSKPWITQEEAAAAADKVDAFGAWLQQQEDAQAQRQLTEEPAFAGSDVAAKWAAVLKSVNKLDSKRKPKAAPAAKANETAAVGAYDDGASAKTTQPGGADDEGATAGGAERPGDGAASSQQEGGGGDSQAAELPAHDEL